MAAQTGGASGDSAEPWTSVEGSGSGVLGSGVADAGVHGYGVLRASGPFRS